MEQSRRLNRILDAVTEIRKMDPGIGYYKLWLMLNRIFADEWVPGRDSFLRMMREHGLLLPRPQPRHTTNSNHRYHKYRNLIKGFIPNRPNQLWTSDITYIDLAQGTCYLHLVTDAYSHKIVGFCMSQTLEAVHTLTALHMAMEQATEEELQCLIHHSDRGVQYCCNAYTELLMMHNVRISMTEDYRPTDNAIAERLNGIVKTEVVYREHRYKDFDDARRRISEFIAFYNEQRPHSSIGFKTPNVAHSESGPQDRMW